MARSRVIDADGHVYDTHPKTLKWIEENIEPKFKKRAPMTIPFPTGAGRTLVDGQIWTMANSAGGRRDSEDTFELHISRKGMIDPKIRIKDMDTEGIDIAVLFGGTLVLLAPGLHDAEFGAAICRAYNNWLAEYCRPYPERLKGVAALPLQDPAEAIQELRRCVTELGFVGAMFPSNLPRPARTKTALPEKINSPCMTC